MLKNLENEPARWAPAGRSCLFRIVWLAFALISFTGWLRMVYTIQNWYWLSFARVWPGPEYLAITGAVWGLIGLFAVGSLWMNRPWSRLAGLGAALVYALTYWADRLLFSRAPDSQSNALFALLATLVALGVALLALLPPGGLQTLLRRRRIPPGSDSSDSQ